MIKYPNGKIYDPESKSIRTSKERKSSKSKEEISLSSSNRGMELEEDINISCEYYRDKDIALIYKRPTPINVVKVDYTKGAKITHAYFEEQSTTDYNGVYKGRYLDFEAKMTKSKTSIPFHNITKHQIEHLKKVQFQDGIAFFVISFVTLDETYLIDASYIIDCYEHSQRKSIPYQDIKTNGVLIEKGYLPRLHIIEAIDKQYFKK